MGNNNCCSKLKAPANLLTEPLWKKNALNRLRGTDFEETVRDRILSWNSRRDHSIQEEHKWIEYYDVMVADPSRFQDEKIKTLKKEFRFELIINRTPFKDILIAYITKSFETTKPILSPSININKEQALDWIKQMEHSVLQFSEFLFITMVDFYSKVKGVFNYYQRKLMQIIIGEVIKDEIYQVFFKLACIVTSDDDIRFLEVLPFENKHEIDKNCLAFMSNQNLTKCRKILIRMNESDITNFAYELISLKLKSFFGQMYLVTAFNMKTEDNFILVSIEREIRKKLIDYRDSRFEGTFSSTDTNIFS